MITIYTIAYNEEIMLPRFIRHYRARFPKCKIVVFDNHSTDLTATIATAAGCEVIKYDTNNQLSDLKYLQIKNNCWRTPTRKGWALVADVDELCDISEAQLQAETEKGSTIITFAGVNMVNMANDLNIEGITHGIPAPEYGKSYLFNTEFVNEINYTPGCHVCHPKGTVVYSEEVYTCWHYKYIAPAYLANRYAAFKVRLSEENKRKGMGSQYWKNEVQVANEFKQVRGECVSVKAAEAPADVKLFVCGFDATQLAQVPDLAHVEKANLALLNLGDLQQNELSEHRLHLSGKIESEKAAYIGIATWRWHSKCRHLLQLPQLPKLCMEPTAVYAAWIDREWYRHSIIMHEGIQPYLDELSAFTGLSVEGTGLYGNQFICHRDVMLDFIKFFREVFWHFHHKYGFTEWHFTCKEADKPRLPAIFYERVAAIYFANRKDLEIRQIPRR